MFGSEAQILIVDDMPRMRQLIIRELQNLSFKNFMEASDGRDAWTLLSQRSPRIHLIIADISTPGSTGMDLLRRLRNDSRFPNIAFVMTSLKAEENLAIDAFRAGVTEFVIKPFDSEVLKEVLESAFNKSIGMG